MLVLTADDLSGSAAISAAFLRDLPGLVVTDDGADSYYFYDPDGVTEPTARFPFATVMTTDRYDGASRLERDERTFRVNVGVSRSTYESRFGPAPRQSVGVAVIDTGHAYDTVDELLPHPFYAPMHWVGVVNPGKRTIAELSELVTEAHGEARRRYEHH